MPEDFTLTIQDAITILGKSERTIQRYLRYGKLSRHYITTEYGRELRLSETEVKELAATPTPNGDTPRRQGDANDATPTGMFFGMEPKEFLKRYESLMTQLGYFKGQLEAKEQETKLLTGRTQGMMRELQAKEQKAAELVQAKIEAERRARELAEALEAEKHRLTEQVASSQTALQEREQQLLIEQRRARNFKLAAAVGALLLILEALYLILIGPRLP